MGSAIETETNPSPAEEAFRARLRAANISDESYLATDYLNHFNEIIMLIQLVPDMPEMLDEVLHWQPKTYPEHFRDSVFADRDLAIEAYEKAPSSCRKDLEATVEKLNALVVDTAAGLNRLIESGDTAPLKLTCESAVSRMSSLIDVASAVIHGTYRTSAQGEIDRLIAQT